MITGEVELEADSIKILSKASTPVFPLDDYQEVNEDVRLKNRVLDLRRPDMNQRIVTRSKISSTIRNYLDDRDFNEIETPILTRATPEGARDYILPSRVQPGNFFALPQSPQLFKQMLMMGGLDKYYQVARCFRDEDLRADRQPEFTQIDIEASFIDQDYILDLAEGMVKELIEKFCDHKLDKFPVINWHDSIEKYGCDKPDLRIPLHLVEISDLVINEEFKVFSNPAKDAKSRVVALKIPGGNSLSRGKIDEYTKYVSKLGAKGLAYIKINDLDGTDNGLQSPILKFLNKQTVEGIIEKLNLEKGDLVFVGAGPKNTVNLSMSRLIKKLGEELFFKPLFNNGVFCMRSDSIIWEQWKTEYQGALNNAKTNYGIKTDQLSLNKLIYENFKLISILDSTNNWIVSKSEVIIKKNNFFFTPSFPRRKINILHYTNFSSQDSFLCSENNENKKISII